MCHNHSWRYPFNVEEINCVVTLPESHREWARDLRTAHTYNFNKTDFEPCAAEEFCKHNVISSIRYNAKPEEGLNSVFYDTSLWKFSQMSLEIMVLTWIWELYLIIWTIYFSIMGICMERLKFAQVLTRYQKFLTEWTLTILVAVLPSSLSFIC